ncbi:uncharacterized protein [Montipora foliosa]|uniref:uncharacterized protein n=1 Tax=Montipora foliosa TaxID=591990 RepID=UPI0035F12CB6
MSNATDCPPLLITNDTSGGCKYSNWAYALFALVAIIIVGIPFVAFICYVSRKVKKKKEARGRTYSASLESSSPYPYQPLHCDASGRTYYGAMDGASDSHDQSVRSPSHASTASLADSRASMIPHYDEVSLNHRNAAAKKNPGGGTSHIVTKALGQRTSTSSADSQEKLVDQGGQYYDSVDVVSNAGKGPNDTNLAISENNVYAEIERSDQPPPGYAPLMSALRKSPERSKRGKGDDQTKNDDDEDDNGSPQYAVLEDLSNNFSADDVDNDKQNNQSCGEQMKTVPEKTCDSPLYAVLEATNGDSPTNNSFDKQQQSQLLNEQKQGLPVDDNQQETDPLTAMAIQGSPSEKCETVPFSTPQNQNGVPSEDTGILESIEGFDQKSPSGKSPAKSRTDYENFLLEKVRAMPANERDGTFLIRDSSSSRGSKVLTMYAWKVNTDKEIYNFKVSQTEDGQCYLHKSQKRFSNVNELLEYLRKHKDMLPCVLQTQVFP